MLLPPLAALLLLGGWALLQSREASALEQEIASRTDRLAALRQQQHADANSAIPGDDPALAAAARRTELDRIHAIDPARLDWAGIGYAFGQGDWLRDQLPLWSSGQLLAAMGHLETCEMDDQNRESWRIQLANCLAARDPQAALQWALDHPGDNGEANSACMQGIQQLAATDPAAALAWMDRQIAAGTLHAEQTPSSRDLYESALFEGLLCSDSATAATRLATLSPTLQADLLTRPILTNDAATARAALIRKNLPAAEAPAALAKAFTPILYQGYAASSSLLDRIDATPAERLAVAQNLADQGGIFASGADLSAGPVGRLRDFLAQQAPDQMEELTGRLLGRARMAWGIPLQDAFALAQSYDADGSKGVLAGFIRQFPPETGEDLTPLLEKIADPAEREELRQRYAK